MSDSGVEAGSDADSLGEMSVGSSASSNDGINQPILQGGDQEQQIQVDDHQQELPDQGQHIQQHPQPVHLIQQVIAVGVSSANQQQIHLPVAHQLNSITSNPFPLQMPSEFNHPIQFDQSVSDQDLYL